MNIPSLKKYCFILIMTFCQFGRVDASQDHPENKATSSLSASSSPEEKRKMLQDLNNFGKNRKNNGDLKKHLPSENVPLNNNLPSDMLNTFGTAPSSHQEILENNEPQNNQLPLDQELPTNAPLNNNLPSDMVDTFGTAPSSQQEILENNEPQNNQLPLDQEPSINTPLNNNLPSDMVDTFGTAPSSQQEILENDEPQNNQLPLDQELSTSMDNPSWKKGITPFSNSERSTVLGGRKLTPTPQKLANNMVD